MDSFLRPQRLVCWSLLLTLSVTSLANRAWGDDSTNSTPDDKAERIEVTGSHIRRTDVEGVSPVQTITHKDIEQKGYDSLGDVVRDLGANSFGSNTVSGNSTAPGNADINLGGLGSDNTLVLLNGQRLPQDAVTGTVDINLIPIAAVDRVEILKDGASAIYGSDALAGVVNIITKKDYKGTAISIKETLPTNYSDAKKTQINAVNGINTDKLNIVNTLSFRYDQPVYSSNRPWSNNSYSMTGNPPSYANQVNGTDGTVMTTANCPANLLITTPAGTFCQFKYSDYSQEAPEITQIGAMSEAHYEESSDLSFNSRLSYVHRDAQTVAAPAPGDFILSPSTISKLPSAPTGWDGTDPIDVMLRLTPLGPRNTDVQTNSYGGVAGATVQLPHDWQMDMTSTASLVSSHLEGSSGYALTSSLQNLIDSGTFNPFAPVGQQGNISSAAYVPTEDTKSILTGFEAKASGALFEGWAGPVSLAIGSLVNYSDYYDQTDSQTLAGNVFGNAGSEGGGHRTSEAAYAELSLPVINKVLEFQLAGRFDHYSDFGSTTNPKIGFLLHVSPSWLIRGSYGTGFRAPLLSELYSAQTLSYPSFIDHVACAANPGSVYCQAQQYQVTSGGNPNLKQETSTSYTLGTVFAPTGNFNVGADGFFTKISNMPGIDYGDMTLAEQNGINPSQYGVTIVRDANGIIQSVNAPLQNLAQTKELGVDITSSYSYKRVKFSTEQNQLFYYETSGFPGVPEYNKLGWNGMPAWRNTSSISYLIAENQDASITTHTIPKQRTLDNTGELTPLTTVDLSYTYRTKKSGDFSIAIINVLNSLPPFDASNPDSQVNYSLYDPNGRQVVLGYQVKI
jgi:iron complex outermembrane receptor protein